MDYYTVLLTIALNTLLQSIVWIVFFISSNGSPGSGPLALSAGISAVALFMNYFERAASIWISILVPNILATLSLMALSFGVGKFLDQSPRLSIHALIFIILSLLYTLATVLFPDYKTLRITIDSAANIIVGCFLMFYFVNCKETHYSLRAIATVPIFISIFVLLFRISESIKNISSGYISALPGGESFMLAGYNLYVSFLFLILLTIYGFRRYNEVLFHEEMLKREILRRQKTQQQLEASFLNSKKMQREKDRLSSLINHEIRTQLAVISRSAEMAKLEPAPTQRGGTVRVDRILEAAKKLENLIETFLRKQRHTDSAVIVETFDVVDLVQGVIRSFDPLLAPLRIEFNAPPAPVNVEGDVQMLEVAVTNLTSNAIKYTPDGERIEISVTERGPDICIEIKDRGIGVPENELCHVTDQYFRASNVGTASGVGLGLSIVQYILDCHGGTLNIHQRQSGGTVATLCVPKEFERHVSQATKTHNDCDCRGRAIAADGPSRLP